MFAFRPQGDYWNGTDVIINAFFLGTVPVIDNWTTSSGPWGASPFNFTTNVTDEDNNTVWIWYFMKKGSTPTSSDLVFTDNCTYCDHYYSIYQHNFTCNASYSDVGTWYITFKFNDTSGFGNQTTQSFTVDEEPISIQQRSGDGLPVNRSSGSVLLSVYLVDTVLNQNVTDSEISTSNVKFWVFNSTSYFQLPSSFTPDYYYNDFNPNCSLTPGVYKWKVNESNEPCYVDAESLNFSLTIFGDLSPTLTQPDGSTNYTEGAIITLRGYVQDDCGINVTDANVYFNLTNLRTNESFRCPETGYATYSGGYYTCDWDSTGKSSGWYNVTMNASKAYYNNDSYTRGYAFFLVTPVKLTNPTLTVPDDGSWGEPHNFSVVVDHYTDVEVCLLEKIPPATEYTVTNCTTVPTPNNQLVSFIRTYTCAEKEKSLYYRFNASEPGVPESYSETDNYTHYVTKDDVEFIHIYGNETSVNRQGGRKKGPSRIYNNFQRWWRRRSYCSSRSGQ